MIIRIEVEAVNVEDLKAKLEGWIRGGSTAAPVDEQYGRPVWQSAPGEQRSSDAPEVVSEKKPVGRPRKAPEAVVDTPTPAPKAEPKPEAKVEKPKKYTLDQVRSALQTYAQKVDPDASVGILKVRELLAQFQSTKHAPCQKISEVQDQDYAALVAACGA